MIVGFKTTSTSRVLARLFGGDGTFSKEGEGSWTGKN